MFGQRWPVGGLALWVVSLLLLGACGGGSSDNADDDPSTTGSTAPPLSQEEFESRAHEICAAATETAGQLVPTEGMTGEEVAASLASLADATDEGIESLAALRPPQQQDVYEAWLDLLGRSAAAVRDAAIAMQLGDNSALADRLERAEDTSLRALELASELGLDACRFGAPEGETP